MNFETSKPHNLSAITKWQGAVARMEIVSGYAFNLGQGNNRRPMQGCYSKTD